MTDIGQLESLLVDLADGEWEHGSALTIESIDNPGWGVHLCVTGSQYADIDVDPIIIERTENDWLHLKVEQRGFEKFLVAACGPRNLAEAIEQLLSLLRENASPSTV